ncbi:hypothetical protein [Candidatus Tisiphia endosymbiont of Sialis lutaria]
MSVHGKKLEYKMSLRADVSPGNCCKIARIDRISSLFNDDGDSRLWM